MLLLHGYGRGLTALRLTQQHANKLAPKRCPPYPVRMCHRVVENGLPLQVRWQPGDLSRQRPNHLCRAGAVPSVWPNFAQEDQISDLPKPVLPEQAEVMLQGPIGVHPAFSGGHPIPLGYGQPRWSIRLSTYRRRHFFAIHAHGYGRYFALPRAVSRAAFGVDLTTEEFTEKPFGAGVLNAKKTEDSNRGASKARCRNWSGRWRQ